MTCAEREGRLALLAGDEVEDADLERHVAGCAVCAAFVEDLREIRGLLAATPVTGEHALADGMRASVMSSLRRRRVVITSAAIGCVAASLLVLAFLTALLRPVADMPVASRPPRPPQLLPAERPVIVSLVSAVSPRVAKARARLPRRRSTTPAEPVVVKLLTDDPNVVIVWITD